jgi:hypothetical protein
VRVLRNIEAILYVFITLIDLNRIFKYIILYSRKYSKLIENRFKTKEIEDYLKQFLIINKNLKEENIQKYLIGLNLTQRDNLIAFGFDLNLRSIESTFVV